MTSSDTQTLPLGDIFVYHREHGGKTLRVTRRPGVLLMQSSYGIAGATGLRVEDCSGKELETGFHGSSGCTASGPPYYSVVLPKPGGKWCGFIKIFAWPMRRDVGESAEAKSRAVTAVVEVVA